MYEFRYKFVEKCILNGEKISVTTIPDTHISEFMWMRRLTVFLIMRKPVLAAGLTEEETARALTEKIPVKVALPERPEIQDNPGYTYYFRYRLPYLFLGSVWICSRKYPDCFHKKEVKHNAGVSGICHTPESGGTSEYGAFWSMCNGIYASCSGNLLWERSLWK